MRYLIDSHVLIWFINGDKNLTDKYIGYLENSENELYVSIASLWEIAIKMSLGKLELNISFEQIENYLLHRDFNILQVSFNHLNQLLILPKHHGDPFDRLLISQAITEDLTIVSVDRYFKDYAVVVAQ
jgi:PIN domain nuclease of toxin-antitoxin system